MKILNDAGEVKGMKVLLRLDLNVPIADGVIRDEFRIRQAAPTIEYLKKAGAKTIIIGHIEGKGGGTLEPVSKYLQKDFPHKFIKTYPSEEMDIALGAMGDGDIILLENLRLHEGEKANSEEFAKMLADYGNIYVNEAFSVSHREHASIVGISKLLPSYAGFLFKKEVDALSRAFKPEKPFLLILGGAKFETKMPVIEKFLKISDKIFVGGALANNFFRDLGNNIGQSVVSEGDFGLKKLLDSGKIVLPVDVMVQNDAGKMLKKPDQVVDSDAIWDVGPAALTELKELVDASSFVLWNGPLGNYEIGFKEGTEVLAKILSESKAETIVGGGDTIAAIEDLGIMNKFDFVSTAGGAMLDFLVDETLPGVEVLS